MYRVLVDFLDMQDGKRLYKAGDKYPRRGLNPPSERIEALLNGEKSSNNLLGKKLIEHVETERKPPKKKAEVAKDANAV